MDPTARRIRKALLAVPDVQESAGAFTDGDAFWVNGTEIAHFHGDNTIEIRLTKANISTKRGELKQDVRVELRRNTSDWLTVRWSKLPDVGFIAELAEVAACAHRPRRGVPSQPPPQGEALARRRRFH